MRVRHAYSEEHKYPRKQKLLNHSTSTLGATHTHESQFLQADGTVFSVSTFRNASCITKQNTTEVG